MKANFLCHVCGLQIPVEIDDWHGLDLAGKSCPQCGNDTEFSYIHVSDDSRRFKIKVQTAELPENSGL
ncbi:MAG: hypothetical protein ACE5MH_04955 [Terriglobia bacterium]